MKHDMYGKTNLWFRFSGKILWLKATPTNHDPRVVARYYLEYVEEVAGKFKITSAVHCKKYHVLYIIIQY